MEQTMQRRVDRRRRRKRERRRWKLVRYLLAAAAILLSIKIFFQISDIQVEGNVLYSESDVVKASGLRVGGSSLTVSNWLIAHRIRSELPGISSARVMLTIPDKLYIHVSETHALAVLETEAGPVLLSRECKVVSGYKGDVSDLVHIRGISPVSAEEGELLGVSDGESTKLSYLQELLPMLEREGILSAVQDIDISNVSDLHFRYQGRLTVRLGVQEKLLNKLDRLLRIVNNEMNAGDSGILDLSTEREGHYIPG